MEKYLGGRPATTSSSSAMVGGGGGGNASLETKSTETSKKRSNVQIESEKRRKLAEKRDAIVRIAQDNGQRLTATGRLQRVAPRIQTDEEKRKKQTAAAVAYTRAKWKCLNNSETCSKHGCIHADTIINFDFKDYEHYMSNSELASSMAATTGSSSEASSGYKGSSPSSSPHNRSSEGKTTDEVTTCSTSGSSSSSSSQKEEIPECLEAVVDDVVQCIMRYTSEIDRSFMVSAELMSNLNYQEVLLNEEYKDNSPALEEARELQAAARESIRHGFTGAKDLVARNFTLAIRFIVETLVQAQYVTYGAKATFVPNAEALMREYIAHHNEKILEDGVRSLILAELDAMGTYDAVRDEVISSAVTSSTRGDGE